MCKIKKADKYLKNALKFFEKTYIKEGALYEMENKIHGILKDNFIKLEIEKEIEYVNDINNDYQKEIERLEQFIEAQETEHEHEINELNNECNKLYDQIENLKTGVAA